MKGTLGPETNLEAIHSVEEQGVSLDRIRVRYLRSGSGPPLLLLHGLLGYSFSWRFAMPVLAHQATVYAVDMPGAGFSERPADLDCCLKASAERLLRFLDVVGLESCDLLGTSQGGAVAMMAAAIAPRRVRRLFGDARRIRPGTLEGYSAPFALPGAFINTLAMLRSWNRDLQQLESMLPRINHIPTLMVWGSVDRAVTPESAHELLKHFQNCRVVMLKGVGHLPYEEVPE